VDARLVIERLGLEPHPEGGWYRQTWRHEPAEGSRGAGTAIYYLLAAGERSAWRQSRTGSDAAPIPHLASNGVCRRSPFVCGM
jgi:predicted cupin superfamily sugar epimerase